MRGVIFNPKWKTLNFLPCFVTWFSISNSSLVIPSPDKLHQIIDYTLVIMVKGLGVTELSYKITAVYFSIMNIVRLTTEK